MAELLTHFLLFFLVPLWLLAGIADWWCHLRSGIEYNSGTRESILHLLLLAEVGVAALAMLFLEINAAVLLLALIALALHEATALWDVGYATKLRRVTAFEQHVHSFLEIIPLTALALAILLHWSQFLALLGLGDAAADFSLRGKDNALPMAYTATLLAAMILLQVAPYTQELWRCLQARNLQR